MSFTSARTLEEIPLSLKYVPVEGEEELTWPELLQSFAM
jgi:hypothetical protein